ncbi:MAG: TolC family protein [Candidatus Cloacimonas sp.]|jgi:outer membrane protein TolC|nr:TolC family protein [Candidatus Cloacimonas sp.]
MKPTNIILLMIFLPMLLLAKPLSLEQARQLALQTDHDLQSSQAQLTAASEERKAAFSSFLPSVALEGGFRWDSDLIHYNTGLQQLPIYDFSAGYPQLVQTQVALWQIDQNLGQQTNAEWALKATQPLFTGGKIMRNYQIHTGLFEIARQQTDLKRQTTLIGVDESYWRVVELQAKVQLAMQYRASVQTHLNDLDNYLSAGLATNNDLLKARVKSSEAELSLLQAQDGLTLAMMDLCRRIGYEGDLELVDSLETAVEIPDTTVPPEQRSELEALNQVCKINQNILWIKKGAYLPEIGLEADYKFTRPNPYNSFKDEYGDVWQVYLKCRWELFDFAKRKQEISAAKSKVESARLTYNDAKDKINLEIMQEQLRLQESLRRIELARVNLQQADENLRVTTDMFHAGVVKSSDLLDAETLWLQASSNLIEAMTTRNLQTTRYLKASGRL